MSKFDHILPLLTQDFIEIKEIYFYLYLKFEFLTKICQPVWEKISKF